MREVHPIALVLAKRSHFTLWSPPDAFRPAEFLGYSDSLMAFKTVEALSSYVDRDEDPAFGDAQTWAELNLPPTLEPLEEHVFELDSVHMWLAGDRDPAAAAEIADLLSITADLAARYSLDGAQQVLTKLPSSSRFIRYSSGENAAIVPPMWDDAARLVRRHWRSVVSEVAGIIDDADTGGQSGAYSSQGLAPQMYRPQISPQPLATVGRDAGIRIAAVTAPDGTTVYVPTQAPISGEAIAALVASLLWIFGAGSLLAIVMGHNSFSQIRAGERRGRGLAVTALILGYLGIVQARWFWFVLRNS